MEERLLLNGIALHSADISPRHVELSALVEADFTDANLSLWNGTAMPTGKAADAVTLNRLVKFAFSDVLIEYFAEGGQRIPLLLF
jgi:hypothetical protein